MYIFYVTDQQKKSQIRDPFAHIKSSGYGQKSSKPLWSPADVRKHKERGMFVDILIKSPFYILKCKMLMAG